MERLGSLARATTIPAPILHVLHRALFTTPSPRPSLAGPQARHTAGFPGDGFRTRYRPSLGPALLGRGSFIELCPAPGKFGPRCGSRKKPRAAKRGWRSWNLSLGSKLGQPVVSLSLFRAGSVATVFPLLPFRGHLSRFCPVPADNLTAGDPLTAPSRRLPFTEPASPERARKPQAAS